MERPDKTEWYLMLVAQRVEQLTHCVNHLLSKKRPPRAKLEDQRLRFEAATGPDEKAEKKRKGPQRDPKTGRLVFTRNKADMTEEELERAKAAALESKAVMAMRFGFDPRK